MTALIKIWPNCLNLSLHIALVSNHFRLYLHNTLLMDKNLPNENRNKSNKKRFSKSVKIQFQNVRLIGCKQEPAKHDCDLNVCPCLFD